jgi:hypothetical protein
MSSTNVAVVGGRGGSRAPMPEQRGVPRGGSSRPGPLPISRPPSDRPMARLERDRPTPEQDHRTPLVREVTRHGLRGYSGDRVRSPGPIEPRPERTRLGPRPRHRVPVFVPSRRPPSQPPPSTDEYQPRIPRPERRQGQVGTARPRPTRPIGRPQRRQAIACRDCRVEYGDQLRFERLTLVQRYTRTVRPRHSPKCRQKTRFGAHIEPIADQIAHLNHSNFG